MNLADFKKLLRLHPAAELRFQLPDGGMIDAHAHITEVGRVDKTFVDCGGTVRKLSSCLLQSWVADDVEHRLLPDKLADILDKAAPILADDELPMEIEYEDCVISQFPVTGATAVNGALLFTLGTKHTDCLAKDVCIPQPNSCCSASGCC